MGILLGGSRALVADMRAVVVVAEKDEASDEIKFAADAGVVEQHLNPPGIAFRPFWNAGAIPVLGDDDRLLRKSLMD